jgi:hypothetical protein
MDAGYPDIVEPLDGTAAVLSSNRGFLGNRHVGSTRRADTSPQGSLVVDPRVADVLERQLGESSDGVVNIDAPFSNADKKLP